jgi:hypothetical protein
MAIVWLGVPPVGRARLRMEFDGPPAVFEGSAFSFLCEKCEAFREGLSAYLDEYGYRVIDGAALEEFGWLTELLLQTVEGYPEEWPVTDWLSERELVATREAVLYQLRVLSDVVARARTTGRPVECWGE